MNREQWIATVEQSMAELLRNLRVARLKSVGRECTEELTAAIEAVDEYKRSLSIEEATISLESFWPRYFELLSEIDALTDLLRAQRAEGRQARG